MQKNRKAVAVVHLPETHCGIPRAPAPRKPIQPLAWKTSPDRAGTIEACASSVCRTDGRNGPFGIFLNHA
jgi:hypothetical protein